MAPGLWTAEIVSAVSGPPIGQAPSRGTRGRLHAALLARRPEIERALLTRVYDVADLGAADPVYRDGLRAAVSAALDYGLSSIEHGERGAGSVPTALPAQARQAARNGIGLDTVLRRYFAGFRLLGEFLMREAVDGGFDCDDALLMVQRDQAALFDRLIALIAEEYGRETRGRSRTLEERRSEQVRRLLGGEPIDPTELSYGFDCFHTGLVASGPAASEAIRDVAGMVDRRLLIVDRGEAIWAWLGGRRPLSGSDLVERASSRLPSGVPLSIGEPAKGIEGWRLTHHQATAAFPIALRGAIDVVRYTDVAMVASALQDDLLRTSLRDLYVKPLKEGHGGGKTTLETLRAYFAADRNVSSAAARLGVSRQTVGNRLRAIEERFGRPLGDFALEMQAALRIEELDRELRSMSPSHQQRLDDSSVPRSAA